MKTNGSHGPSGLDAGEWRRLLTSYKSSSIDLCKTVSKLAIRIATEELNFLNSYNACRPIALDKCPGVRPIGIGEVLRRIIGRTKVKCVKRDLQLLGRNVQMRLEQKSDIEHAIHALRRRLLEDRTEGILLIAARNAFNSLNRDLALINIRKLCPSIYTAIRNSCKNPSDLFVDKSNQVSRRNNTR